MKPISIEKAELLAKHFRVDQGLSLTEVIYIKGLLTKLNIITVFRPLSQNFCGMALSSASGAKFMLINSNHTAGRQHFTIAHELFHLYYDTSLAAHICSLESRNKNASEVSADRFAAALLMPEEGIRSWVSTEEIINNKLNLGTILRMENYYSVSLSAMLVRLNQCKMLSKDQYAKYSSLPAIETAQRMGFSTALYQPCNSGVVIGDFGEKAYLLFDQERISEGHYQELLNLIKYDQN